MTVTRSSLGRHYTSLVGLLLTWVGGCAQLAPGIVPLPEDPPEYAALSVPIENASTTELATPSEGSLIPVDSAGLAGERYVARQYPRTYPAPPPPGTAAPGTPSTGYQAPPTYQPPSVYQLPAPAPPFPSGTYPAPPPPNVIPAPQPPATFQPQPTFQPPASLPLPPAGTAVIPSQPSMPPSLGSPSGPILYGDPSLGAPFYGDPSATNDPYAGIPSAPPVFVPNTRTADLEITGYPARTGRIMVGGAVNSDAGVTGQLTIDERNFDITRWPRSFQDLASGTAFRGAGQTLRLEAVPGSRFKRYTASFADPNLFGYLPISFGVSGFLYDRRYQDYDEERLGGRVSFGYRVTPDLSLTTAIGGQNVDISNPRVAGVAALDNVLGDNELYTGEFRLTHDTRDSPFMPSEGHFFEFGYEKVFGDFDYSRFEVENRNYLLVAQRADGSGKQTLTLGSRLGFSGDQTPLFENYFAGGYSTIRGFDFRGASPVESGVQVGGRFQWLNTLEYMFPITADDAFRGVAFVDFGTVERDIEINKENFRVAPGLGLRVAIPMLGPAPLAFDFAYPVTKADGDQQRIFSFYMSAIR